MHHPWRDLRSRSHLRLRFVDLPPERAGTICTDGTLTLAADLLQVERRCVLTHELVHDERGIPHVEDGREESFVEQEVARRLIELDALADALRWSVQPAEVAADLWVTVDVLLTRIKHLHPSERAWLRRGLDHDEW